jgi:hypothetical protein
MVMEVEKAEDNETSTILNCENITYETSTILNCENITYNWDKGHLVCRVPLNGDPSQCPIYPRGN